ncbi:unnamed protein product [Alopecurus aequalis]
MSLRRRLLSLLRDARLAPAGRLATAPSSRRFSLSLATASTSGSSGGNFSNKGSTYGAMLIGPAAVFLGLSSNTVLAQDDSVAPAATSEQADADATGLRRIEDCSVISNEHTIRWRICTDNARDFFLEGKLDEAEKLFKAALLEAKEGFGLRDPHVASALNNLAEFYRLRKEYEKAEPLYLEAIEILEQSFGPDDIRRGRGPAAHGEVEAQEAGGAPRSRAGRSTEVEAQVAATEEGTASSEEHGAGQHTRAARRGEREQSRTRAVRRGGSRAARTAAMGRARRARAALRLRRRRQGARRRFRRSAKVGQRNVQLAFGTGWWLQPVAKVCFGATFSSRAKTGLCYRLEPPTGTKGLLVPVGGSNRNPLPGARIALNITRVISPDLIPQGTAYRACIQILVLLTAVEDAVIDACMITEAILNPLRENRRKLKSTIAVEREKIGATAALLQALEVVGLLEAARRRQAPGFDYEHAEQALRKCISLYNEPHTRNVVSKVLRQHYVGCLSNLMIVIQQDPDILNDPQMQDLLGESQQIMKELREENNTK